MKWHLFHGIDANRRENRLAKNYDVVTPTVSILGLVNLQPVSEDIPADDREVEKAFAANMEYPWRDVPRLGHMLEEPANFGIHNGQVKFRDGGDRGLERTLLTQGGPEGVARALVALTTQFRRTDP